MLKKLVLLFAFVAVSQAFGGWTESNEISDEVMDIARWSASQLSAYTNANDHTIMTVKNLKKQVVAGVNYKFTLEVVASLPENKYAFKSCEIGVFDQSWTNTRYFFQTPVCSDMPSTLKAVSKTAGGWTESNVISDEVMDIARWSASQLSAYTNGNDHTIMTVKNLKTQIVSGKNYVFTLEVVASLPENKYAFKSCEIGVYEQKWTNTRYFFQTPVCSDMPSTLKAVSKTAGGWTESNVISDEVMDIARWSASQLSAYTNANDHTIMTVKNLKKQVVAGVNYKFTLEVVASLPENKYAFKSCEIAVFDQSWTNTRYFFETPVCSDMPSF